MKQKVMKLHKQLVTVGKYSIARKLLRFLKDGYIKLYFNDDDWATDNYLAEIGYISSIDRRGYASYSTKRYK